ncbi:hypothetical protein FAM09_12680 [Niastella caeni]|uniref:Deoxynucleoside kinase domain-containing protein n=1 Tax=Niastella caeni TaxID=2569763 RepID=A0A4S8HUW0_9BACT|nr:hypothetical protein [Niastella caeni]THU39360.1 hypothetical protein FAM09_12680 [Niastella caeni]
MNSKIIEIIGPPGVGKSTIYKSLCKIWKPGSQWVYPDVLMAIPPPVSSFKKWLVYHLRLLMRKKLTKSIPVDYGLRFDGQQQKLAEFCWKHLSDTQLNGDKEINKRFRSAYFLFATFCIYQAILEKAPEKPCVIEEGFLQKSFFIRADEKDDQLTNDLLNNYLHLVPLPYAIIYIDTPDTNEIVKRLRGRKKTIASHMEKDDEALRRDIERWKHTQNFILEKLKNAGVLILRINGKQPVKENVSAIIELLKKVARMRETGHANISNESSLNPFIIGETDPTVN